MERIIAGFVSALRESGIRVSPGESLDAVQALGLCGMTGRKSSRQLLRLTLVKNVNDIPVFNEVFNQYFSRYKFFDPEMNVPELMDAAIVDMEGEFNYLNQRQDDDHDEQGPLLKLDSDINPEDLQELKSLTEIDPDDSDGNEIVVQMKGYRGKAKAPRPTRRYTQNPLTIELNKNNNAPMGITFTHEEQIAMQDVVSRMMMRLRKDMKRMKNNQNRGKLHVIKTIQKNYRHDMVPFQVALRRKRREKPRLVVLCDVSFSVSHASRFMLLLLHTLHNQMLDVRSFIFNREVAEITEMLANMPVNDLMETIDKGDIVDLDANSSFGQVFLAFKKRYLENLRGRPAFIILGDARNNYDEANDWVLDEIREKARYMLWLTPEERDTWKRGDCLMEVYGSYCDKVEVVKTVEDLSLVVEDLLRDIYADHAHPIDKKRLREAKAAEVYDSRDYYTRGSTGGGEAVFDPSGRSHW
ncbi:MAG: CoxE [Geobacteraceae bacterium GWC2_55_20]|nr:MAG: CoxE [Geobacteraceae bacterium GWC2_55_20]OGU25535.1 MAG: CoxE [Geobacteraceae bacterium GWF2_54_21]HBA72157.1 CoxE [Geobacter sp.]HCE68049.1 CoxE [Geobacter sp.]